MTTILNIKGIKIGDKLTFNYGAHFPTKVGTVESIVASRYSKHGAFASVEFSKKTDEMKISSFSVCLTLCKSSIDAEVMINYSV